MITPEQFGSSVGTGGNDYQAFADALKYLEDQGGGMLSCSAKRYRIDRGLRLPSNVTFWRGGGSFDFGKVTDGPYLLAEGREGPEIPLTNDASAGDTELKVRRTPGLAEGDMLRLFSTEVFDPGRTDSQCGEPLFIKAVTATSITLTYPLQDNYPLRFHPKIARIEPVKEVHLAGPGLIKGNPKPDTGVVGVRFYRALHCSNAGGRFIETDVAHFEIEDGVDCHIYGKAHFGRTRGSLGYGVDIASASRDCSVTDCDFDRCRHAFTTSNSSGHGGIPRYLLFADSFIRASEDGDAVDTHSAAEHITFRNLKVTGAAEQGINAECPNVTVAFCEISNTKHNGIALHNESDRPGHATVFGNIVRNCGGNGISVRQGTTQSPMTVDISHNLVDDVKGDAIIVTGLAPNNKVRAAIILANRLMRYGGKDISLDNVERFSIANNLT